MMPSGVQVFVAVGVVDMRYGVGSGFRGDCARADRVRAAGRGVVPYSSVGVVRS